MSSSKSVKKLCKDHDITPPTAYKEMAAGRLRSFKIGRSRRIAESAEAEWIEQAEAEAARDTASPAAA